MLTNEQIDRLIAEKVMGWTWWTRFRYRWFGPPNEPELCEDLGEPVLQCTEDQMDLMESKRDSTKPPRFSTDPAASKLLREKLAEEVCSIVIEWNGSSRVWSCQIWPTEESNVSFYFEAKNDELAVALCALKSVGIEAEK